ncbi:MAG: hypothetical protein LBR07_01770 [Puniceicoccales bacterium]|nr:hypothetical protein [Puniceicoccales bacterium]
MRDIPKDLNGRTGRGEARNRQVDAVPPVAVIDLGSNTLKVTVATIAGGSDPSDIVVSGGGKFKIRVISRVTEEVRISPLAGEPEGAVSPRAMRDGAAAARRLLDAALAAGATRERVRIVATSMVRDAANGAEFCAAVAAATGGLRVEVLDGLAEARGVAAAVATDPAFAREPLFRVVDLGGGSLEHILVERGAVRFEGSRPLGAARLTRRFVPAPAEPIPPALLATVEDAALSGLAGFAEPADAAVRASPVAGCGGVFSVARAIFAAREGVAFRDRSPVLPVAEVRRLRDEMAAVPLDDRICPALSAQRADIFPVALTVLLAFARVSGAAAFRETGRNLRIGLIAQMLAQSPAR